METIAMSKRILMVIAPQDFRDEELSEPREIFEKEGWTVEIASTKICQASGMLGAVVPVTRILADIRPNDYDAVVVVGGMGSPGYLWNDARLHEILQTIEKNGKVVASICLSGAVLAKAGLLNGKKATVWEMPESLEALSRGGAVYTGEPVTVDGRIITANGPDAARDFGRTVVSQVKALLPAGA
jgi:protease I